MDTDERPHCEGKAPVDEDKEEKRQEKKRPVSRRSPSPDPDDEDDGGDGDDDGNDDDEDKEKKQDLKYFDINRLKFEVKSRVMWEVHDFLAILKQSDVTKAQHQFAAASGKIQFSF